MLVTDYTTYEEIRSLLGVSARELADAVIGLPHWMLTTEQELMDIVGGEDTVMTTYATIKLKADAERTAAESQFFKVTSLFVLYDFGLQLAQRADVFSFHSLTDGKTTLVRIEDRFDKLKPALEGGLQRLKERLKEALQALTPDVTVSIAAARVYALGIGLGTDPVTGT